MILYNKMNILQINGNVLTASNINNEFGDLIDFRKLL